MSSKPALVLVTGSFTIPELYTNITEPLKVLGFEVSAPQLLSAGKVYKYLPSIMFTYVDLTSLNV